MSNLSKAVEAVKEQHKPVHRHHVTFYNQNGTHINQVSDQEDRTYVVRRLGVCYSIVLR